MIENALVLGIIVLAIGVYVHLMRNVDPREEYARREKAKREGVR